MTIKLGKSYENQLRQLASQQGRDVGALVLEAVRDYLEAASITDLSHEDVAQTQLNLVGELAPLPAWSGRKA